MKKLLVIAVLALASCQMPAIGTTVVYKEAVQPKTHAMDMGDGITAEYSHDWLYKVLLSTGEWVYLSKEDWLKLSVGGLFLGVPN